jgi:L-Ala-D/L-Glu epimerase
MKFSIRPYVLEFKHAFGVSSNSRKTTPCIFIRISANGLHGYGEACLPAYLGETEERCLEFFRECEPVISRFADDQDTRVLLEEVLQLSYADNAAKAAVEMALCDLEGKRAGKPYFDLTGIGPSEPRLTSYTIGIDTAEKLEEKIIEASDFSILKIKAGTHDDKTLIRQIRKHTYKPLYLDVNQGWKDRHQALDVISFMKEQGVILVEQPMPVSKWDDAAWLKEKSPLPLIADESVKRLTDLEKAKEAFHGINIKLMKCTGLAEARQMVDTARNYGMKVMLGCMAESSCAVSAMSQLLQFADYADLDAPMLYRNDPFRGVSYEAGKLIQPSGPGIGAEPLSPDFFD